MVSDSPKPSRCLRVTAPQIVALAVATALAILALALLADLRNPPPAPAPRAPHESVPVQPLVMPLRS
jgi:hypothetical protein